MKWICSFKAYGDLVIACNFLRDLDRSEYGLLAGSHLKPLLQALDADLNIVFVEVGATTPAFFDAKKCGYINSVTNGFTLRQRLRSIIGDVAETLVFDTLGFRQRFLAWPLPVERIDLGKENIYLDYLTYFNAKNHRTSKQVAARRVLVFPDSRIQEKTLPDLLLLELYNENAAMGIETVVVKIGSAPMELPGFPGQVKCINGFDKLIQEVMAAEAVVSADSLPAHIAEYFHIPVFVFTPKPNNYWMPLSSYLTRSWSIFYDFFRYRAWIRGESNTF